VGFEPTVPVFERAKTVLQRAQKKIVIESSGADIISHKSEKYISWSVFRIPDTDYDESVIVLLK
jgi:hypothetical protein